MEQTLQTHARTLALAAAWLVVMLTAVTCALIIVVVQVWRESEQLDRAFLAGMETGNQMCAVLLPEHARRRPSIKPGELL